MRLTPTIRPSSIGPATAHRIRASDTDSPTAAGRNCSAVTNNPGGFNYKQFRSNVVFRWEYRPGSTLFVVWTQGRHGFTGVEGTQGFRGDLGDLFTLRPDNSFLVGVALDQP